MQDLNPPNSYKLVGQGNSPVGFASGEAKVLLTEENGYTVLTYDVEANVGGKIAQVGGRLIDMTAKKMADIFGKFKEIISPDSASNTSEAQPSKEKKPFNKKIIYASAALVLLAALYLIIF